jgi:hypothetical protein
MGNGQGRDYLFLIVWFHKEIDILSKQKGGGMKAKRRMFCVLMATLLVFGMAGGAMAAWGTKELDAVSRPGQRRIILWRR